MAETHFGTTDSSTMNHSTVLLIYAATIAAALSVGWTERRGGFWFGVSVVLVIALACQLLDLVGTIKPMAIDFAKQQGWHANRGTVKAVGLLGLFVLTALVASLAIWRLKASRISYWITSAGLCLAIIASAIRVTFPEQMAVFRYASVFPITEILGVSVIFGVAIGLISERKFN